MGEVIEFPMARVVRARDEPESERPISALKKCDLCIFSGTTNDGVDFCRRFKEEILFQDTAEECGAFDRG